MVFVPSIVMAFWSFVTLFWRAYRAELAMRRILDVSAASARITSSRELKLKSCFSTMPRTFAATLGLMGILFR